MSLEKQSGSLESVDSIESADLSDNSSVASPSPSSSPSPSPSPSSVALPTTSLTPGGGYSRATLVCRPNSHPFQDRQLVLDQPVKVGRSVARARPSQSNGIFDCKVLSRNHALLWYENGKFFLQDTKSSNGTFVNNQRLSKGSEESLPREVCSGDILQFGVDVMENSRKVTHGCIIATLKLFLPDGKEAKASPTIVNSQLGGNLPAQDLNMLNQYIQEALAREQLLESKLAVLQKLVGQTQLASSSAWKSLIDEDRLLTRVEILESQLSVYGKSMNEDKLREETQRLMDDKEKYQELAKETLKKSADDKMEAVKHLQQLKQQLVSKDEEFQVLQGLYEQECIKSKQFAADIDKLTQDLDKSMSSKDEPKEGQDPQAKVDAETQSEAHEINQLVETVAVSTADTTDLRPSQDQIERIRQLEEQNSRLIAQSEVAAREAAQQSEELESKVKRLAEELERAQSERESLERELEETRVSSKVDSSSSTTASDFLANLEDEAKMVQLLKIKEKYNELTDENKQLKSSLHDLETSMDSLNFQSQTASACALIPLAVLCVAFVIAYLPLFSSLFGTAEL